MTHRNRKITLWLIIVALAVLGALWAFTADVPDANAADLDDLAQCESGGNPNYEDGTFSGAFNYLPSTWRDQGLSGRPSDHSYEEQKAAAAALIRRSGQASQFPGCTAKLGTVTLDGNGTASAPAPAKTRTASPSPARPATPTQARDLAVTGPNLAALSLCALLSLTLGGIALAVTPRE